MDDETSWSKLDGAVYCRLHTCCSLSDRVQLLSDTIYQQAALIFGHPYELYLMGFVYLCIAIHFEAAFDNLLLSRAVKLSNIEKTEESCYVKAFCICLYSYNLGPKKPAL